MSIFDITKIIEIKTLALISVVQVHRIWPHWGQGLAFIATLQYTAWHVESSNTYVISNERKGDLAIVICRQSHLSSILPNTEGQQPVVLELLLKGRQMTFQESWKELIANQVRLRMDS